MRRLLLPLGIVVVVIVIVFLGLPNLEAIFSEWVTNSANQAKSYYSMISFSLLAADVFLPIPSSIIMFLNGSVLGVFWGGVLSLISSLLSAVIGYYFGKLFYHTLNKRYTPEELEKAASIIRRFGFAGIIMTRGVPILAEAVSILTGNMAYRFRHFFLANFIGFLPICLLYAYIGSQSLDTNTFLWAFGINILIAGFFLSLNLVKVK
jgi:uncharacterized membrane protein YdjX (TVP38/TMEM64 family)